MVASVGRRAARQPLYSGTASGAPMAVAAPAGYCRRGGLSLRLRCSCSYQLGFADRQQGSRQTPIRPARSSVIPRPIDRRPRAASRPLSHPSSTSPMPAPAAAEVLTRGDKDASVPWENPQTGARGTVTPLASNYNAGRLHLPRFPRELRPRRRGSLAAGRGLPHGTRASGRCRLCGPGNRPDGAIIAS